MSENAIFLYAVLATFVVGSLDRNVRLGRPHLPQLAAMGWMLFLVSLGGAAWMSIQALGMAVSA